MKMRNVSRWTAILLGAIAGLAAGAGQAEPEQFIPVTIYRTGPMGGFGTPPMVAYMDYMAMLNERDGGINGVKLVWEECETAYQPDRMVECYQRLKDKNGGATVWLPFGTGLAYAILDKSEADKIPVVTIGNGRTDSTDGRYFPYSFPLISNFWSQETSIVRFIASRSGGEASLKGKKIVNLYHDSAYGKETLPILGKEAEQLGFELLNMPVAPPGIDQKAIWLQIRQAKPDWIIVQGAGLMTATSIKEAAGIAFPRDHMIGNYWSGAEEDTVPAGPAAKGYIAAAMHGSGVDYPVLADILKYVYDRNKGNGDRKDVGTVRYNRGVVNGMVIMEGIRVAQEHFGKGKPITGEQLQYGLENLKFTVNRVKALGATELTPVFATSCKDHEGGAPVRFQQWDGAKWVAISPWIASDQALVRPMVEASAEAHAKEKNLKMRNC